MTDFEKDYPRLASWLRGKGQRQPDPRHQGIAHWGIVVALASLAAADFRWQVVMIACLIGITALFKGPGMLFAGVLYAVLVSLLPPLGVLVTAFFFFLSLWQLQKSWRFYLFASAYFAYPLLLSLVEALGWVPPEWGRYGGVLVGMIWVHFALVRLYQRGSDSRSLALALFTAPFDGLLLLLPKRFKKHFPDYQTAQALALANRGKKPVKIHRKSFFINKIK